MANLISAILQLGNLEILLIFVVGYLIVQLFQRILSRPPSNQQILANVILAFMAGSIVIIIRRQGYLPVAPSIFVVIFLFTVIIVYQLFKSPTEAGQGPSIMALINKLIALFVVVVDGMRRLWEGWRWVVGIIMVAIFVLGVSGFVWARSRPETFRVAIELQTADPESSGNAPGTLRAVLEELQQELDGPINIILDPVDNTADMEITFTLNNSSCAGTHSSDRWGWTVKDGNLKEMLELLLVDAGGPRVEDENDPCKWTRTKDDLAALIWLTYGLDRLYVRLVDPDNAFAEAYQRMSKSKSLIYQTLGDSPQANEALALPRRLQTCALVMDIMADGPSLTEGEIVKLRTAAEDDPFSQNGAAADFCVAQAHYWLGRDALNHHLQISKSNNSASSANLLVEAREHFDQAIEIIADSLNNFEDDLEKGPHWAYYFFRGLTSYRQGNLNLAISDIEKAEVNHSNHPIDEWSVEMVSYFRARLLLESSAYPLLLQGACKELSAYERGQQPDVLVPLRLLQKEDEPGLAPFNIGAAALFNEAIFWQAIEQCGEFDSGPPDQLLCHDENESDCSQLALKVTEQARLKIDGDRRGAVRQFDSSAIDIFLAQLHLLNDPQSTPSVSEKALEEFAQGSGAPAYVIPVSPTLDPYGGRAAENVGLDDFIDLTQTQLEFQWLLRNAYDEPLFDYSPLEQALTNERSSHYECELAFCASLADGQGQSTDWPLHDLGYGVFTTHLPRATQHTSIPAQMAAEPGPGEQIYLWGDVAVSLRQYAGGEQLNEIDLGTLTIATLGRLLADADVEWTGRDEAGNDCELCFKVRVTSGLVGEGVEITRLAVRRGNDGRPTLVFRAALFEKMVSSDAHGADQGRWQPIDDRPIFDLHPIGARGSFEGLLPAVQLSGESSYAIRVYSEDRNGRVKASVWLEDLNIVFPR